LVHDILLLLLFSKVLIKCVLKVITPWFIFHRFTRGRSLSNNIEKEFLPGSDGFIETSFHQTIDSDWWPWLLA
jgi:hypothetical protein